MALVSPRLPIRDRRGGSISTSAVVALALVMTGLGMGGARLLGQPVTMVPDHDPIAEFVPSTEAIEVFEAVSAAVTSIEPGVVEPAATDEPTDVALSEELPRDELAGLVPEPLIELAHPVAEPTGPRFDGRPLRVARTIEMLVTAYSPDERSCGIWADGYTASGLSVWTNGMKLVAADTRILPFRSVITVPGYDAGRPVPVLDRGGKIKGNRLDVLFPTHEEAMQWGVKRLTVTVWEYAD